MAGSDEQASRLDPFSHAVRRLLERLSDRVPHEISSPEPGEDARSLEAHGRRAAPGCELTRPLERGEAGLGIADLTLKSREEQRLESHLLGRECRDLLERPAGMSPCGQQPRVDVLEQPVAARVGAMEREKSGGLLVVTARQGAAGESDIAQDEIGQGEAVSR